MNTGSIPRTECDCHQCKAACKAMPGMLAPGDLEHIADQLSINPEAFVEFLETHFVASDGPLVAKDGKFFRIPTIVPAQKPDGHCVFLDEDDSCKIHGVAPFGCSRFNVCDGPETISESNRRSTAALVAICQDENYWPLWHHLESIGKTAPPLVERRQRLADLTGQAEARAPAAN